MFHRSCAMMSTGVKVRPGSAEDVQAIVELLRMLFAIEADFTFDEEKQTRGVCLLLERNIGACVLVAECEGEVVGTVTVQGLVSTAEGGRVGIVEDVVVSPSHRGRGIGTALLRAACMWAASQNMTRLQLLADKDNVHGLAFYDSLGWARTRMVALRIGVMQPGVGDRTTT